MFVDVPEPVWYTSIGNWSSSSPASTAAPRRRSPRHRGVDARHVQLGVDGGGVALDPPGRGRRGRRADGGRWGSCRWPARSASPTGCGRGHVLTLWTPGGPTRTPAGPSYISECMASPPCGRRGRDAFRRPVRPRRCVHADRRHPLARVDQMFDEFLVPRGLPRSLTPTTCASSTASHASTASAVPASRGIALPDGDPSDPRAGFGDGARQPQERSVPRRAASRRHRSVPGLAPASSTSCATRHEVAVVSSSRNAGRCSRRRAWRHGFEVVADGVVAAEERIPGKPAPDMFLEAADRLGVDRDRRRRRRGRRLGRRRRERRGVRPRRRRRSRRRHEALRATAPTSSSTTSRS